MKVLSNHLKNMNLQGILGSIISANEKNWLHKLLEENPGLFEGFRQPENADIWRTMWHGEFPGKLLTGIAQTYLLNHDPNTKALGDRMTELFGEVQSADGYLGPWPEEKRFNRDVGPSAAVKDGKWDTWGQYHCIYGLYRWYQVTGNKSALTIAKKSLDCIYEYFIVGKRSFASQKWAECNFAISHAFALLYEEMGDSRYLEAAEYIVKEDWKTEYLDFYTESFLACNWLEDARRGVPFFASNQCRWESLYTLETLAVLYRITGKTEYQEAMDSLWWGMVASDRHNTGSFGTGEGANGNLYGEGSETCNTVAWMAFSTDYLKMSRNSYVADELELSCMNAVLGSLLDGERNYTYMNNSNGKRIPAREILIDHYYAGARDMSCCQANGNRGVSQISEWAVLTGEDGLYLNYYGESQIETTLIDGTDIRLSQKTDYPRSGTVRIEVSVPSEKAFSISLRIPVWSKNTMLQVNGEKMQDVQTGKYYTICRAWKNGDVLELKLDMSVHFWDMDYAGVKYKVSTYYGPLLLAFNPDEKIRGTVRFDLDELRNIQPVDGNGIVNFRTFLEDGQEVRLKDYYTAGKKGEKYVSWMMCKADRNRISFEKNGIPIWCVS